MKRTRSFLAIAVLALGMGSCGGSGGSATEARLAPTPPASLVLITVDTLRADRVGPIGGPNGGSKESSNGVSPSLTPNIDRFAAEAVRLSSAYSTSSFTPPAHASLLTSRYVAEHGLLTWEAMGDSELTLAEVLEVAGYETAAFVNLKLLSKQNLGQGFTERSESRGAGSRNGRAIVAEGLEFIAESTAKNRPFFLWLHLYDVHRPYGGPLLWQLGNGFWRRTGDSLRRHYALEEGHGLPPEDLEYIGRRYDLGVRYADRVLGPLLEVLSTPRHRASTMVVLTSDHGESLLEHSGWLFAHDPYLYPEVTRVPMVIRFPGRQWRGEREGIVSLIDVAPTALDVLGVPVPSRFGGESLLPAMEGAPWPREEVYMECWGWQRLEAVQSSSALVVLDLETGEIEFRDALGRSAPALEARTTEQHLLADKLRRFAASPGAASQRRPLDEETREQLRALGYLGALGEGADE